jgi:hypothetical protein
MRMCFAIRLARQLFKASWNDNYRHYLALAGSSEEMSPVLGVHGQEVGKIGVARRPVMSHTTLA